MRFWIMLVALFMPMAAFAHDYKIGDMMVMHPVAFETTPSAMSGAGYFTVTNTGDQADRLLSVEADFPRVMIHDTKVTDGVATMFHIDAVTIAPGETVALTPGAKHVMFMGLNGDPFEIDEKIPATLVFENAGRLAIEFNVEPRPDAHAMDHSNH
jgi:hypothetical protein